MHGWGQPDKASVDTALNTASKGWEMPAVQSNWTAFEPGHFGAHTVVGNDSAGATSTYRQQQTTSLVHGTQQRDTQGLRRVAAIIACDSLFLSLQGDSNSRSFAEDR